MIRYGKPGELRCLSADAAASAPIWSLRSGPHWRGRELIKDATTA